MVGFPYGTTTTVYINPGVFGAKYDMQRFYGASVAAGTNQITVPGANIGPSDIGKPCALVGAGATLAIFSATLAQNQFAPLIGYIGFGSAGTNISLVTSPYGGTPANATQTVVASGNPHPITSGTSPPSPAGTCIWGTDDTVAIQLAVYTAISFQTIYGPSGHISVALTGHSVITSSILWDNPADTLPANGIDLIGPGRGGAGLHMIGTPAAGGAIHGGDSGTLKDCTFEGFELDGCGHAVTAYNVSYKGLELDVSSGMRLTNLYVHDFPATGIACDDAIDTVAYGCEAANNGRLQNGLQPGGAGFGHAMSTFIIETSQYTDCIGRLNGGFGIFYENLNNGQASHGMAIEGGKWYNNGLGGIGDSGSVGLIVNRAHVFSNPGGGIIIAGTTFNSTNPMGYDVLISNCQISGNGGKAGILLWVSTLNGSGQAPTPAPGKLTVTGCRIYSQTAGSGIRIDNGLLAALSRLSFTDNDIVDNFSCGIWMRNFAGTTTITDVDILNNRIIHNGTGGVAASDDGIRIDVNLTGLRIKGNTIAGNGGFGLNIGNTFAGTVAQLTVCDNDFQGSTGNTSGPVSFAAGVTKTVWTLRNNIGYNPVGATVPATAFAIGATTVAATNSTGVDITLYALTAGAVTAVSINGVALSPTLAIGDVYRIKAGGTFTMTYTVAPTFAVVGD